MRYQIKMWDSWELLYSKVGWQNRETFSDMRTVYTMIHKLGALKLVLSRFSDCLLTNRRIICVQPYHFSIWYALALRTRIQSLDEWKYSPKAKKSVSTFAGLLLVNFKGAYLKINCARYSKTSSSASRINDPKISQGVILQHDNVWPNVAHPV